MRAGAALTLALALHLHPTGPAWAQHIPPAAEPEPITAGVPAPPGTYDTGIDVLHYDVEIGVGRTEDWIAGRARLAIRTTRSGLDTVQLDFTGLAVDRVSVDGHEVADFSLAEGRLRIPLGGARPEGAELSVGVEYRGVPDDGLILGENVHGARTAFVDNWPNRARFWLPSVDHPSDKATARFTVHAPADWSVIANGRPVGQPFASAPDAIGPASVPRRTWVWSTSVPQPTYTLVFGAGPLVSHEVGRAACGHAPASPREDGCIDVTTWLFPEDAERGRASFERAAEMVDFFTEVVGPFPFAKLAHVQSATRFGGMENSSAIFYSQRAIAQGADIEGTVSHETAHQWFGDAVTEVDWPHLWLSEGFATYFGALFFEYEDGPEALRTRMAQAAEAYLASPDTLRPVVDTAAASLFDLLDRNSYQKGAWVLHMLRGILGDEVFFDGIRSYYASHRDGVASTQDLRVALEQVSGKDLGWFFDQWLARPGYPVLQLATRYDPALGEIEVKMKQVQGAYAPRFRLPLTLELRWAGGQRRERVTLQGPTGVWRFAVPAATDVTVDPDAWVLKRVVR